MNHSNAPAFYECMYLHYDQRLQDKSVPPDIRAFFHHKQKLAADNYCRETMPLRERIITKILNTIKMVSPQFPEICTQLHTDAILHMAAIISHRHLSGLPCFIHSNSHRIALKDAQDVVICWVRVSK